MKSASVYKKLAGGLTALALCTSSTGAIAASAQHATSHSSITPLVALSALWPASRAARIRPITAIQAME